MNTQSPAPPLTPPTRTLTLSVFGCLKQDLAPRLAPLTRRKDVRIEYQLDFPLLYVRLILGGSAAGEVAASKLEREFRALLGHDAYAEGLHGLAEVVINTLKARRLRLTTAESCTGGLLAGLITSVPGASEIFELGLVTYGDEQKRKLLGVPADLLATHGAVSREVAVAMSAGALKLVPADIAVAITGIAGPSGGSREKPVGTVHFGLATARGVAHLVRRWDYDRHRIREIAAATALDLVRRHLEAKEI